MWQRIIDETNQHGYMSGVDRQSDRVKATGEIFTPTELVVEIIRAMPEDRFGPGQTVLDPACGDGQFLVPVKLLKMYRWQMTEAQALDDIYGVDIMRDNVDLCKKRLNGGHILMGNTLNPSERLPEQSEAEHIAMMKLFGPPNLMSFLRKSLTSFQAAV